MRHKLTILLALSILAAAGIADAVSWGISPPEIDVQTLLPGSHYEKIIYLSKDGNDMEIRYEISGDITEWITTDAKDAFVFENKQMPVKVSIDVPGDAEIGKYNTILSFRATNHNSAEGIVLEPVLQLRINTQVINKKVSDYEVISSSASSNGNILQLKTQVKNNGNIADGPDKLAVTVFDKYYQNAIYSEEINSVGKIEPFTEKTIDNELHLSLEPGQYWAEVKSYGIINEEKTYETLKEEKIYFEVGNEAAINSADYGKPVHSGISSKSSKYIAAVLLLMLFIGIILLRNRNTKKTRFSKKRKLRRKA